MTTDIDTDAIVKAARRRPLWVEGPATVAVAHKRDAIERLLPHRDPFLFVQQITAVDLEQGAIRGRRRIDPADGVFVGHFPGEPIYPGVLQIETMGQLGLCLFHFVEVGSAVVAPDSRPRPVRATRIHSAQFLTEVRPGDELEIYAKLIYHDDFTAACAGQLMRNDVVVSVGVMEVYFVEA